MVYRRGANWQIALAISASLALSQLANAESPTTGNQIRIQPGQSSINGVGGSGINGLGGTGIRRVGATGQQTNPSASSNLNGLGGSGIRTRNTTGMKKLSGGIVTKRASQKPKPTVVPRPTSQSNKVQGLGGTGIARSAGPNRLGVGGSGVQRSAAQRSVAQRSVSRRQPTSRAGTLRK